MKRCWYGVKRCWCELLVLVRAAGWCGLLVLAWRFPRLLAPAPIRSRESTSFARSPSSARTNTNNQHQHWLLPLLLALTACTPAPPPPAPHEAYVWQRQWTPAVVESVKAQAPRFSGWRVLALQVVGERVVEVTPDLAALAAAQRPVRAVVRIEGARAPLAVAALWPQLAPLMQRWRAAGVRLAGIEIDHDCATAALGDYAGWLRELRGVLPADVALSLTALPAWLESPALAEVLAAADASVLQVHAVDQPQRGLFDAARAAGWIEAWDALGRPFHVALPAYGVRIATDAYGALHAVDAEGPVERTGAAGAELRADPRAVAGLLRRLAQQPPAHLTGYLWFRLPVAGDQRSWSPATLAAVRDGAPLAARFVVQASATAGGAHDLVLRNDGNLDAAPPTVELPAHCRLGDALGRYRLEIADDGGLRLSPGGDALLRAATRMQIGWVRCEHALEHEWSIR